MSVIGDNIKKFRIYKGLSQRELSDKVERTSTVVSNWENGNHCPDVETLEKLCRIFGVTPNEILGWEKNQDVESFYQKQESILLEIEKLNKARDRLDAQIFKYYKELKDR